MGKFRKLHFISQHFSEKLLNKFVHYFPYFNFQCYAARETIQCTRHFQVVYSLVSVMKIGPLDRVI